MTVVFSLTNLLSAKKKDAPKGMKSVNITYRNYLDENFV